MIPKNTGKEHIIKSIEEIQRVRFPKNRISRKYLLKHNDGDYAPKYVVSLANKYINGRMLEPFQLGGGSEINGFLERLGFEIVGSCSPRETDSELRKKR